MQLRNFFHVITSVHLTGISWKRSWCPSIYIRTIVPRSIFSVIKAPHVLCQVILPKSTPGFIKKRSQWRGCGFQTPSNLCIGNPLLFDRLEAHLTGGIIRDWIKRDERKLGNQVVWKLHSVWRCWKDVTKKDFGQLVLFMDATPVDRFGTISLVTAQSTSSHSNKVCSH